MIIALDAGHYNNTPGKRCLKSIDPNETRERFLNARMAEHVEELLKAYDCEVMRCDDRTGKTDPSLSERAARANRAGAAAFISIHHNAGINGGKGGGICVYAAENASKTSLTLQRAVYDETVKRTGLKGNRATPLPIANFTVIYKANMPAVLGEFGFMDSTVDTPIILTDDFSKKCARGIVDALVKTFNFKKKEIPMSKYYSDTKGRWSEKDIDRARELGLMLGVSDTEFGPTGTVSREQLAVVVVRLYDKLKEEVLNAPDLDKDALFAEFKRNLKLTIEVG